MKRMSPHYAALVLWILLLAVVAARPGSGAGLGSSEPVYLLINNHVEGDYGFREGDPLCAALIYQKAKLPPPGPDFPGPSYALDIAGTARIRRVLDAYTDRVGRQPRVFICPAGEFWQTEADPVYGGRLFETYNYLALGEEFGIQGHAIYYSGQSFCWYNSPHTPQGIQRKLTDLHEFAERLSYQGHKVNHGLTLTGGHKLEAPHMGVREAEWWIDHVAYGLGYRVAYEDHDGHVEDEPAGINNQRSSYYLYRADYGDGTRVLKIDMNGSLTERCGGNTPRCETSAEAATRLDATLAARAADPHSRHIYYFATVVHAGGVWHDYNRAVAGLPMIGEGKALLEFMGTVQARVRGGADIRFVTPAELATLFVPPGDLNCDGAINNFDIDPFVLALTDSIAYARAYPHCDWILGDVNGDGVVNNFDIDPFVTLLSG